MIRFLQVNGFTKREIARRMGLSKLVIKDRVRVETEDRITAFYNYYVRE